MIIASTHAALAKRIALVIGIDSYTHVERLKKAVNDARVMGDTLAQLGFEVMRVENVEIAFWNSIKNSKNPEELQSYLKAYPRGAFAPLAKIRLAFLTSGLQKARKSDNESVPRKVLPIDINIAQDVLSLVETHPFFANAPAVKIRRFRTHGRRSGSGYRGSFSQSTTVHWLRSGITLEESKETSTLKYTSWRLPSLTQKTSQRDIYAANGLISLGGVSSTRVSQRSLNTSYDVTTTKIGALKGRVFPVKLGNKFLMKFILDTTMALWEATIRQLTTARSRKNMLHPAFIES